MKLTAITNSSPPIQNDTTSYNGLVARFLAIFVGDPKANPIWLQTSIIHFIGIPLFCIALIGGIYLLFEQKTRQILFIGLNVLVPFVGIFVLAWVAFSNERYVFLSLPFWMILGAATASFFLHQTKDAKPVLVLGVIFILLITSIFQTILYYKYQNGYRHDWKSAVAFVQENKSDDDLIAISYTDVADYYFGEEVLNEGTLNKTFAMERGKRIWIIDGVWGSTALPEYFQKNSQLMGVWDVPMTMRTLIMRVYLYTPDELSDSTISNYSSN